jgi:peptidoglycan/LPS O-acetylase OafA/YrhL
MSAFSVFYAACLLVIITSARNGRVHAIMSTPPLTSLGKYSYAMYVFHLQFALLYLEWANDADVTFPTVTGSALPMRIAIIVSGVLLSYGAAYLSWHLYEKHFLKLKRHFERRRPRPIPTANRDRPHPDEQAVMPAP